jgi:hypothetical protein
MDLESVSGEALPKRTFVESFRIVCWQFLVYQHSINDLPPVFDDCPKICHIYNEKERDGNKDYCTGCDVGIAKASFEQEAKAILDERLGNKWKKYKFEHLLNLVYDAFDLKESGIDLTVTSEIMVSILVSEQNRQRRIEDYNRRQKQKET